MKGTVEPPRKGALSQPGTSWSHPAVVEGQRRVAYPAISLQEATFPQGPAVCSSVSLSVLCLSLLLAAVTPATRVTDFALP